MKILVLVFFLLWNAASFSVESKPYLTLEMATTMAEACEKLAEDSKWRPINIAIYDDGANLKLFRRQDNSFLHSIEIAHLKAKSSAGLPYSTRALGELAYQDPNRPHGIQHVPGLVVFPGGLPIITESKVQIGGIGVSGATGDQDEECAQIAINSISRFLK
tara:strand:+ start:115 stop:597 length:483 start_codon:yes stop_codon:yes gene_type:complete